MTEFKANKECRFLLLIMCVQCVSTNHDFIINLSWITGPNNNSDIVKAASEEQPSTFNCYHSHSKTETTQCSQIRTSPYIITSCDVDFDFVINATHLIIKNSQIPLKKLKDFLYLRYLVFKNVTLSDLNEYAFQGLSLCHLSIVQCGLNTVHPKLFISLQSLISLDLSANGLLHLPDGAFSTLSNLLYLNLSKNNLKRIPSRMLHDLRSLKELDLSENDFYAICYGFFTKLKSIESIHLQRNKLHFFDRDESTVNSTVIHLNFGDNPNLPTLPEKFLRSLGRLENLYLENCGLKSVSSNLFRHLTQLRKLSLKNNYIQKLPSDLLEKSHFLKWLDLSENRLSAIPDDFFVGTPKICELHLSFNSFKHVPTLLHLSTLRSLNLSHNHIAEVTSNVIEEPSNLEILDLSHNFIKKARLDFVSGYKKLLVLQLSYNRLGSPPNVISSYRESLEVMNLSYNLLSVFEIPSVVPYGVTYDLRHNQIRSVNVNTNSFFYTKLIMSHSEFLGRNVVSPNYYLSGNILNCDCTLRKFLDYSVGIIGDKHGYPISVIDEKEIRCSTPESRAGLSLRKAHDTNLTCIITKDCPLECSCYSYQQYDNVYVNCSKSNLFTAPRILPANTTILDLNDNYLSSFSANSFQNSALGALREIHLRDNNLSRIQIDLEKSGIRMLDLRNNAFLTVPMKLSNHTTNFSLFIGGNPLICDCPDMFLKKWIDFNGRVIVDAVGVQCWNNGRSFLIDRIHQNDLCSKGSNQTVIYNGLVCISLCLLYFIYIKRLI